MKQLTPCQRLGYNVGDKFEVIETNEDRLCGFTTGQVVTLFEDDFTLCPFFQGDNSEFSHYLDGGVLVNGAFLSVEKLKPLYK
jgi:hypothetical protein